MKTVLDQWIEDQEAKTLGASLDMGFDRDPVRQADIARISKDTMMSDEVIDANLDQAKILELRRRVNESSIVRNNPGMAKYLSNPQNAAIAQRDIDWLLEVEDTVGNKHRAKTTDLIKKSWFDWAAGVDFQQVEAASMEGEKIRSRYEKMLDVGVYSEEDQAKILRQMYSELAPVSESFAENVAEMAENMEKSDAIKFSTEVQQLMSGEVHWWEALKSNPGLLIREFSAANATNLAAGAGTAMVGGALLGPVGFAGGSGLSGARMEYAATMMQEIQEAGYDITNQAALRQAFLDSDTIGRARQKAITRAAVIMGTDYIMGGLATKIVAPSSFRPMAREMTNVTAQVGADAVVGGTGETLAMLATGDELSAPDILAESIGGGGTAVVSVAGAAASGVRGERQVKRAKVEKEVANIVESVGNQGKIDKLIELSQSAKKSAMPDENIAEAISTMEVSDDMIFLAPEAVQEAIDAGVEIESPSMMAQLQDALESGQDIELTTGQFVSEVAATDAVDALRPHMRWGQEGKSKIDLGNNGFSESLDIITEAAKASIDEKESSKSVLNDVKEQLIKTGVMREPEAKQAAAIVAARVETIARDYGLDPAEVYKDFGLEIKGPSTPEDAAPGAQPRPAILEQGFGDLMIKEEMLMEETGQVAVVERPAQQVWDTQTRRMNAMNELSKCLG